MTDMQSMLDSFLQSTRQQELNNSNQLLLGELILKLEGIINKKLPLVFDIPNTKPHGIGSWRGIYKELAIYTDDIGSIQTGETEDYHGYSFAKEKNFGKVDPTVEEFLLLLKQCIGSTFTGYKGGDFTMNKNTPINICKETSHSGFMYDDNNFLNTWIVDIKEDNDEVVLITGRENVEK